jgi:phage virion morphogenesis protein
MLKVSISGDAEFKMDELQQKTKKLPRAIAKAALYMERQTKLNFAKETDPDGQAWAELSPSTLARKKTSSKLRETSSLVNSIAGGSSGLIGFVNASVEYGIYHQTGTNDEKRGISMPARKFLGIGADDVTKIEEIIRQHLGL